MSKFVVMAVTTVISGVTASSREFLFTNNCDKDLWLYFTSGSAPYANGQGVCHSDTDCINGSVCNLQNGICFWDVPIPSTGVYRLPKDGGNSTVQFPILVNDIIWSGNIRACIDGTCDSTPAECDKSGCRVKGPSPVTLVEFTLIQSGVDFYDISILNGFNVPVEFSPVAPFTVDPSKPYDCGNPGEYSLHLHSSSFLISPGGRVPLTGSGSCSWEFSPPRSEFKWVQEGNENLVSSCSSDDACSSFPGTVCGMSINAVMTCGELLGYWTLDQFCGQNLDEKYPAINCDLALPSPNSGQTLWNLLGCVDVPSCYQTNSGSNCCGCVDWQNELSDVSPLTEKCLYSNPNWLSDVYPTLKFLKAGCPSAYTYPYDDHSSTFVCSSMDSGVNMANYAVTYCPK